MKLMLKTMVILLLTVLAPMTFAGEPSADTGERMKAMVTMCETTAAARVERHASKALYERLGGYERIHVLTREIVRRHKVNPDIRHMFVEVDGERLARHVADFVSAGTGGSASYTGRGMPEAHAHLKLSAADFLSAGNDIVGAMQALGHGEDEINEIVCILVSLKDQVLHR